MEKILIPDDYEIFISGLRSLIAEFLANPELEATYDRNKALEKVRQSKFDFIFLYGIPGTDSRELITDILTINPRSKILVLGMQSEKALLRKYLQAGVMGLLSHDATGSEIKSAIDNILNDKLYMSPKLLELLLKNKIKNPFDNLTSYELQSILYLINGDSITATSAKLDIHSRTLKKYLVRIFEKLGCKDLAELNSMADAFGLK